MLDFKTPRSRVRLYAAAWTAAVAAIPAYIAAGTASMAGTGVVPERIPLTLLAILAAGISGYWIGWRLIDPNGDHIILGSVFLGAVICLFAYYLLGVMVGAQYMVPKVVADTTFTFPDLLTVPLQGLASIFGLIPFMAIVLCIPPTWYTFAVAGIAGFVLSFCYRRRGN
jgi:hypothetical protein